MTAKEFLSQAWRLDQEITTKIETLDSLNALATKATATITGMPRNPSPSRSPMEDVICKIIDLQDEINADIDRLVDLKKLISDAIREVDDKELRLILEKRYINNQTWPEISVDLGYKMRYMFKLHDIALGKIKIPASVQ